MTVKIINNLSAINHGNQISELIRASDEITIASPYLLPDFEKYLSELNWNISQSLHLITTLVPESEDQIRKIKSLQSLVLYTSKQKVVCRVSIDNSLHGKVYIFRKRGHFTAALISSANMTTNGMKNLHEWGVLIGDPAIVEQVYDQVISSIEFQNINHSDILDMYLKMNEYLSQNKLPKATKISLNLSSMINGRPAMRLGKSTKYWLKPVGHALEHVNPKELYNQSIRQLRFSKVEPTDVRLGDILIAFAVGSGKILSVFKVMSKPSYTNDGDRWPWYVDALNLTSEYGSNWWSNNLSKEYLKGQFQKQFPNEKIKPSGTQGFGAFNWGKDRLLISSEFGSFIIDEVLAKSAIASINRF